MKDKIAGIILAAGESSRLGTPKQLLEWNGKTLINHAIQTALDGELDPVIVVLGSHFQKINDILDHKNEILIVNNLLWKNGQSTSLVAGIQALGKNKIPALFLLSDQPFVTKETIKDLVKIFKEGNSEVVMLETNGKRTPPIVFSPICFEDIRQLAGDRGARDIVKKFKVEYLLSADDRLTIDIDTEKDYEKLVNNAHSH
jgi:molybdenum cofactor cytidylyltransferase